MRGPAWLGVLGALSGLCGLAYEVLWARMLGLQFGVSSFAAIVTVAAFMLGLATGCALAGRISISRPLRKLAMLEAGISLFALLLPWGVELTTPLIDRAAVHLSVFYWHGLIVIVALLLLTLPATAMGAGFPFLLAAWTRYGRNIGMAYGTNTLGAALGALLPLLLLPTLGWNLAIRVVAGLGLLGAAGLVVLDRAHSQVIDEVRVGASLRAVERLHVVDSTRGTASALTPLLGYTLIGVASIFLEMSWLRLFSLVMLRTEYVLALILGIMLVGMGCGSLMAARRLNSAWLDFLPWCASLCALVSLWALPTISAWIEHATFYSLVGAMLGEGLILAFLTLPITLCLGAWLPLLANRFDVKGSWLYMVNCLGAALGALVYVLCLPTIGSTGALVLAALLLLLSGLYLAGARRAWWAVPLVAVVAASLSILPPVKTLLPASMAGSRDLYRYEDAIAITQVVEQRDGQRVLLTDLRRRDASTEPVAVLVQTNQARLPLMLHPSPKRVLFLGIGTGISLAGSGSYPNLERTAVELSAGSIEAARRYFYLSNHRLLDSAHVTQDDARHFLSADTKTYDVIIGDLFHPDLAGVGSLLSVEQFMRVRGRLARDGIFVQWLALNQFDPETLDIVLRSFQAVFPAAQLFLDGLHLALVGPKVEFAGGWQGAGALLAHAEIIDGEGANQWLGRYWGPIGRNPGALQHEWAPVIEFLLPRLQYAQRNNVAELLSSLLMRRPNIGQAMRLLQIPLSGQEEFRRSYAGTELRVRSELAGLQGSVLEADKLLGLAYEADSQDRWTQYGVADRLLASLDAVAERGMTKSDLIRKILKINPWSVDAWAALWRLQKATGDSAAEASRRRILELSPYDAAAH